MTSSQKKHLAIVFILILLILGVAGMSQIKNGQKQKEVPVVSNSQSTMTESLINDGTQKPVIYSINPTWTSNNDTPIAIKGAYLNGFEGGTLVWFKNNAGETGVIEASSYIPEGATTLKFTLPNQLCTKSMGESGMPCPSYMSMTRPGLYKVSVQPWAIASNELEFVVTQ
jgi:Na+-transporting methylmalonyl-CoA/oxaloacetate decarboxylase gamma subunit